MRAMVTTDVQDASSAGAFNPLLALQSLLSPDLASLKQRIKAAQQLERYFAALSPTPGLLLSYEPYLPLLIEIMGTGVKNGLELQTSVLAMLVALSSHNPSGFGDWIALNTLLANKQWLVQWSYELVLQTEQKLREQDGPVKSSVKPGRDAATARQECDRLLTRVLHMWRTLLDHTDDAALVELLVKCLYALLTMQETAMGPDWQPFVLKKLQTHFVDVADVFIGWMMSVGPQSQLREEILSLLHSFGRLWADNSVFSLQLLTSFADEIVNLCESWNDYQEDDGDRLSALLVSFVMVAQCVPDLALAADEAESSFARVLNCVALCSQPKYSLFCLANCSAYLVEMSDSKHSSFSTLSVTAARFLLYHCAVQSQMHDSEVDKLLQVIENTCKLASASFRYIQDPVHLQSTAIDALQDEISVKIVKKGGQPKRVTTMECLYQLNSATGAAHIIHLCLQFVHLGGIGALKVLVKQAFQTLRGPRSEEGPSYFVFSATCFILVSRNSKKITFSPGDDDPHMIATSELFLTMLEKHGDRRYQHKLTPRQLCLVLDMASAFIGVASQWDAGQSDAAEITKGVARQILDCAASLLPSRAIVVWDRRPVIDLLKVINAVLSKRELVPVVPQQVFRKLVTAVGIVVRCSGVRVREKCLQVFETLAQCAEARSFACDLIEIPLDLALSPCHGVRDKALASSLCDIARWALLCQEKVYTPRHPPQDVHATFVAADFENVMDLFYASECDEVDWNRICRRIGDRVAPNAAFSNADVLMGAVQQAAGWCVQNRLRTHFGGPAQSFESIDRLLQKCLGKMQDGFGCTSRGKDARMLTGWLMLEFVAALEMQITRTICSTEVNQSNLESDDHRSARFFRTNKMVCDDWLSRIRPCLVAMSKHSASYELCRYHSHNLMTTCYLRLSRAMTSSTSRGVPGGLCNELRQAEKDMDAALFSLCRCHVDAKDADSIVGFQRWGDSISSALSNWYQSNEAIDIEDGHPKLPLFQWLEAMRYEAEMRYEDAIAEYESLLQPVLAQKGSCSSQFTSAAKIFECPMKYLRLSPLALLGCFKQCAKCYACLRAWDKLRAFASQFINISQSLADHTHAIEEIQEICACCDAWSDEIETVRGLEHEVTASAEYSDSGCAIKEDQKKRAALALKVWSVFGDSVSGSSLLQLDTGGQLRSGLMSLALQPSPWNGYAGDIIGKRAEETLLRMTGVPKETKLVDVQLTRLFTNDYKLNAKIYDSTLWSQPFCTPSWDSSSDNGSAESTDVDCLYVMSLARLARKQRNFVFAQGLLKEAATVKGVSRTSSVAVSYEKALVLEAIGLKDGGRQLLETECKSSLRSVFSERMPNKQDSATTRSFLHLATMYAHVDIACLLSPSVSGFLRSTLASTVEIGDQELINDQEELDFLPGSLDAAVHTCFVAAIAVSPQSAKAWLRYSDWCYGRGKEEIALVANQNGYVQLEPSEEAEVNDLLYEIGIAQSDHGLITRAFCHLMENGELINQRQEIFQQLCVNKAPPNHTSDAIHRLVQLQRVSHSKIFRFLSMAARGYDKYLTVLLSSLDSDFSRQTTVALRLLNLLTTYGVESDVVSALEGAFSKGPVNPWTRVVPQLIARARHPAAAVSSLVCLVLKRLAQHSPHIIVYPTVMDAMESSVTFQEERSAASISFTSVLNALQNGARRQVEGVRMLVFELLRISVLWDEAWISTLTKLTADVARRTCTLDKEATQWDKTNSLSAREKSQLVQRKLVAFIRLILVSIERLWEETCGGATDQQNVSPHEYAFLKEYGASIKAAMVSLQDHCSCEVQSGSLSTLQEIWQPFAKVLKALMNGVGRREQLPLHDISPALASASRELAHVNMPGAPSGHGDPITIYRISPFVAVLRTKTKPKSLDFVGSDGKMHKYLLKAREDLRLDERIMQFLRVTNDFLRNDDAAAARDLSARNYSVIPLSRNAGLIQMVPDVVPLFQVYESRTGNQSADGQISQDRMTASPAQLQQPPPPTAHFYSKLRHHGIKNVSPNNRARWPIAMLKQVYQELVAQRPRNVLSQEMLLHSKDLRESWAKSARFSRSLAVMSVLGYIVGLGDRHLDNILLCIDSGDIVHIDHNVCFEKGRNLKVPEIVPFRLTPILQDALGFTGIDGKFRIAFETTLRVVRSDGVRETLMMLFEAFVYSPLVDWISDDKRQRQSGDLKARLEADVNLTLFLSRAEERRQDTVSFGRQYEQIADAITCSVIERTKLPLVHLLEYRKRLHRLENEGQVSSRESSEKETKLPTCRSAGTTEDSEMEAVTAQLKLMSAKISSFADDCLARHRQIETWRRKSIRFTESDPEVGLSAVTRGVETASFQEVHATLCGVLAESTNSDKEERCLAALEPKCRSLDVDVKRVRCEIEKIASYLIPHLSAYGEWHKELDAYLDSEHKMPDKDVYFEWWTRSMECLRRLGNGTLIPINADKVIAATVNPPCISAKESINYSKSILCRLNNSDLRFSNFSGKMKESSAFISQVDSFLQNVWKALSTIEVSNSQGSDRMKLAGASWIIDAIEKLDCRSSTDQFETGAFTPVLVSSSSFEQVVAVSYTCATLLEFITMPKALRERLKGDQLLGRICDKALRLNDQGAGKRLLQFIDVLQVVGSFAVVLQEEFISNVHGRQWSDHSCQDLSKIFRSTSGGLQCIIDAILLPAITHGDFSSVQMLFEENPGIQNAFAAVITITQKISALVDSLRQESIVTDEEAECIMRLSSTNWIDMVFGFIKLSSTDTPKQDIDQEACALWSGHLDMFVSNCLLKLLQYVLSHVISHEWKIDFYALLPGPDVVTVGANQTPIRSRWFAFVCSQILDAIPSTSSNESVVSPASALEMSVSDLMTVCERYWTQQWGTDQSERWKQRMSVLRTQQTRQLRYATWLVDEPLALTDATQAPGLNRVQLLALLSSQVSHLNALLVDQATVEANVHEMVQQMDYIVLALSTAPANDRSCFGERLHDYVQICYSNAVALFDYGRALHDLVEGISMVETSSCEASQVEKQGLEVNSTGEDLLQEASEATKKLQSCIKAVSEAEARARTLHDEVVCKQDMHKNIASDRRAAEAEFRTLCSENEDAAAETTCEVHKHVKDMRALLKDLNTHESPLKKVVSAGSESLQSQSQTETNTPLSAGRSFPRSTTACSFMKNDQLVKELRRSLRSANHLLMLEGTLQRHEEACIDFQEVIGPIELALTAFDTQADQLLALKGHPDASALLSLLLDLVEALRLFTEDSQSRVDTSDEAPTTSLLVAGRDIVRRCVEVFFEAIEMAGRLTGAEEQSRRPSVGMSMHHVYGEDEEEQHADTDSSANAIAIESGSSIVSGAGSDCGSSNYGHPTASPSYIVEEKSRHGLQVLKRIEEKLSGEVTQMAHAPSTLTVEQQASWLIDEATKIDNLCVMYEGWTPWI